MKQNCGTMLSSASRLLSALLLLALAVCAQNPSPPAPQPPRPAYEPRLPGMVPSPPCAGHQSFFSPAMQRNMSYCILLPADYQSSRESYPVLYLLHGLFGSENDWLAKTKLSDYARPLHLIVVMPEADDSWYTNSAAEPRNRYEDYLFGNLLREIESKYRVRPARNARFAAGLSMGGYGAVKAALQHPELFSVVGAFSPAFLGPREVSPFITPRLAFGPPGSPARRANDDFVLLARADPATLPYFFLSCGAQDPLLANTEQMARLMHLFAIPYESYEWPGKHDWTIWDRSVRQFLDTLAQRDPALRITAASP